MLRSSAYNKVWAALQSKERAHYSGIVASITILADACASWVFRCHVDRNYKFPDFTVKQAAKHRCTNRIALLMVTGCVWHVYCCLAAYTVTNSSNNRKTLAMRCPCYCKRCHCFSNFTMGPNNNQGAEGIYHHYTDFTMSERLPLSSILHPVHC